MFVVTVTEDKTGDVVSRSQPMSEAQATTLFNAKNQRVDLENFSVDMVPEAAECDLRVWAMRNLRTPLDTYVVDSAQEGLELIRQIAEADLKNPAIECNAFGLEVLADGEWCEWQDEDGNEIAAYAIVDGEFRLAEEGTIA